MFYIKTALLSYIISQKGLYYVQQWWAGIRLHLIGTILMQIEMTTLKSVLMKNNLQTDTKNANIGYNI